MLLGFVATNYVSTTFGHIAKVEHVRICFPAKFSIGLREIDNEHVFPLITVEISTFKEKRKYLFYEGPENKKFCCTAGKTY